MAKEFFLTKWVRGWRLDKFFENLFQHSPNGNISVQDACLKGADVIDQALLLWSQYEALFDSIASNEGQASADAVKAELIAIKAKLESISSLPDVAEQLQDYRFAEDNATNDFYHSLISTAALAFNDGQISLFEAISFVAQIALFVKDKS